MLGATRDGVFDNLNSSDAMKDDSDGIDDEDGVTLAPGYGLRAPGYGIGQQNAGVTVNASEPAVLNAFIDCSQDWDWDDLFEHVFDNVRVPAGNIALNFNVPFSNCRGKPWPASA